MFYSNASPLQSLPSSKGISFFKHVVTVGFENGSLIAFKQHCFIARKIEAMPFEGKLDHQCETDLDVFTISVSLSTDGPVKQRVEAYGRDECKCLNCNGPTKAIRLHYI